MTDRAREALFSSLGARVESAAVLDLYAGSGALGLEALSRGAKTVVFVERDRDALAALRANVAAVDLGGEVVAADVDAFLSGWDGTAHLAFVDPPYALPLPSVIDVLAHVAARVGEGALVILHRRAGETPPEPPSGLVLVDRRRYGGTELFRFEKETA